MVKLVIENYGNKIELVLKDNVDVVSANCIGEIATPLMVRNGKLVIDGKTDMYSILDIKK